MSTDEETVSMARRALLTEHERDALLDRESNDARYVAVSRIRKKIDEELTRDVEVLRHHDEEHGTELLGKLREVACEDAQGEDIAGGDSSAGAWSDTEIDESVAEVKQEMDNDFEDTTDVEPGEGNDHSVPEGADTDLPAENEISDDVWSVVNEVSASWDDDPERLETRRKAAAMTLQYALTHDVYLGKSSDVVEVIREKYPVEGQNAETWWRKNARDVLKKVGTYSRGQHGYAVKDLEVDDE